MVGMGDSGSQADGSVVIDGRFRVMPGGRLPQFDSPGCEAFSAVEMGAESTPLFALVCSREVPPRLDVLPAFTRSDRLPFLAPLAWGIAHWPAHGGERAIIVFQCPGGERLVPLGERTVEPMRETDVIRTVIRPLLPVLANLEERVLPHRAIRADNLFFGDEGRQAVVLGECVSAPPGYHQGAVYETIYSGMADACSRGPGDARDDLYAFGVTLAILLSGEDSCAGLSDHEIVAEKLLKGSFGALVRKGRVSPFMATPLRGLLCDAASQRWGAAELSFWLEGRKLNPASIPLPTKAARAFEFAGRQYWTLPSLAHGMAADWPKAIETIKGDRLFDWIKRSLPQKEKTEGLEGGLRFVQESARIRVKENQALARLLMLLDQGAPLRYRGLAISPEGLGRTLAHRFHQPEVSESLAEVLAARLPNYWLEHQRSAHHDLIQIKKTIELIGFFLNRKGWGFGRERCLYELNPAWPCQSPLLENHIVFNAEQLLIALEQIASAGPPERDPVDAHVVAFCAARVKRLPDRALMALADLDDPVRLRIGMLRLLATVQHFSGQPKLPALARWFHRLMSSVIESFRNRPFRRELAVQFEAASKRGDLAQLLGLIDNEEARRRDEKGFAQATVLFAQNARQAKWLEAGGLTNEEQVRRGSGQAATLMSAILSGLTLVFLTLMLVM